MRVIHSFTNHDKKNLSHPQHKIGHVLPPALRSGYTSVHRAIHHHTKYIPQRLQFERRAEQGPGDLFNVSAGQLYIAKILMSVAYRRLSDKKKATLTAYRKMLEIVPDLDKYSKWAAADSSHALVELASTVRFLLPLNNTVLIPVQARQCRQQGAHRRLRLLARKRTKIHTSPRDVPRGGTRHEERVPRILSSGDSTAPLSP
jgi:hypothetical protein